MASLLPRKRIARLIVLWVIALTALALVGIAWTNHVRTKRLREERRKSHSQGCSSCSKGGAGVTLPLMDPAHNIREIIKQLVLLEDHCAHGESKFCADCVTKHALAAEALAEEAVTLDSKDQYAKVLAPLAAAMRNVQKRMWHGDITPEQAAKEYRAIRKTLMPHANEMFAK